MRDLLDYANPAQGTDSVHAFSQGNTSPLVARPFAMTHWAPQTEEGPRRTRVGFAEALSAELPTTPDGQKMTRTTQLQMAVVERTRFAREQAHQ